MKRILIACEGLRSHIEKLMSDEDTDVACLYFHAGDMATPGFLQSKIAQLEATHPDCGTISIAAGGDNLPEAPLTSQNCTLVLPKAHSYVALLLGSALRYRQVVEECTDYPLFFAEHFHESDELKHLNFIGRGHESLAYLTDTSTTLAQLNNARVYAHLKNLPYREYAVDYSFLKAMLGGAYEGEAFSVTLPCK